MGVFSPAGSSQVTISASDLTITSVENVTISIPLANTEQSYVIPSTTKKVVLKLRGNGKLQTAFVSGESSTNYWSTYAGDTLPLELFKLTADMTIYFQASKNLETLEILLLL